MNFNIIRNWVGQTSHEAFFEECDRNGIMVWQDFWLANPVDGPNPYNEKMFLDNADNFVRKIRNHPSIILYCGRNEGYPPDLLDNSLRNIIQRLHPGIYYLSNSAWDEVSGGGPYRAFPSVYYFQERATQKFHSEMGRPCIVNEESLNLMMPDSAINKIGRLWGVHDFCYNGAQRASSFLELMHKSFGNFDSISDWIKYAQWLNYDGYRSMFEAQAKHRMGLLLWMSHSAWSSLVWQTYDYYLDPTAAYFGCKKGSEPIHIQWNPVTDSIEVVNYSYQKSGKFKALMEIFNSDGVLINAKSCDLTVPIDSRRACMKVEYPEILSGIYFQRLKLLERGQIISENIYWRGRDEGNLHNVREIKDIKLSVDSQITQADDSWYITTTLRNTDNAPALLVHLQIIKELSGERVLPVLYSDNYITLMPGEVRIINSSVKKEDTGGEQPQVKIEGINLR